MKENQHIASLILHIYADYHKWLSTFKAAVVLQRDYGIYISVGRVSRLMKSLQLPKMSIDKPTVHCTPSDDTFCSNHLQQLQQKAPNLVWGSDITYIKTEEKWYYLCIVLGLFSRKVIAWYISAKPDVELVIFTFKEAYKKRNAPYELMSHSDWGTQYTVFASGSF